MQMEEFIRAAGKQGNRADKGLTLPVMEQSTQESEKTTSRKEKGSKNSLQGRSMKDNS